MRDFIKKIAKAALRAALANIERRIQASRIFFEQEDAEPVRCAICEEDMVLDGEDYGWIDMRVFGREYFMCPECLASPPGKAFIRLALGCGRRTVQDPS